VESFTGVFYVQKTARLKIDFTQARLKPFQALAHMPACTGKRPVKWLSIFGSKIVYK
jgi:hypothetical protein